MTKAADILQRIYTREERSLDSFRPELWTPEAVATRAMSIFGSTHALVYWIKGEPEDRPSGPWWARPAKSKKDAQNHLRDMFTPVQEARIYKWVGSECKLVSTEIKKGKK